MLPPLAHAAADRSPPKVGGSNPITDTPSQAIARALNQPVRVIRMDEKEGRALLVKPLRFHPVFRSKSGVKVCKHFHVHPTATKGRSNNV